ncbi:MAG: LPS export ABC transporter periplasmic protein LptC [bacterium]|nr:LPS export ABC transporter periplasmic protein LptC [bacterium]
MRRWPFAAAFLALAGLAGCARIGESTNPPPAGGERPQQELFDATITFYEQERVSAVLQAGRIRKFERTSQVLLDSGVVMDFFGDDGQHTSTLWADSGRTDELRKDMVAMGNVIARSDSGDRLETTELRWDNKSRQVRSNVNVKLSTRSDTIFGTGFVSDEHLRNWHVDNPVGSSYRERERRARPGVEIAPAPDSAAASGDSL